MPAPANQDFYETLAVLYDQPDHVSLATNFAERIEALLAAAGSDEVLDLGCGTGILAELLAQRGVRVTGLDLSDTMLALARKRCRAVRARTDFVQGDVLRDRLGRTWPVIGASGEIVNHLDSERKVARYFGNVLRHLEPGGTFLFDAIQKRTFVHNWDDRAYYLTGDAGDIVQECTWDPERNTGTVAMTGYVRQARGTYKKVGITLEEYCHDVTAIRRLLKDAGFCRIRREAWCPWPDGEADHDLWSAERPAG